MALRTSTSEPPPSRRYPIGVELLHDSARAPRAHSRVWAPACESVEFVIQNDTNTGRSIPLEPEGNGYFAAYLEEVSAGTRYRLCLNHGDALPDPASRFQPEGPHGPSCVIDAATYEWSDAAWKGVALPGQIIYELHIGTFTAAGTFRAAIDRLPDLVDIGVTVLEVMPLADFAGQFGWGYDGVNLFAPSRLYGTPDDLRAFIDAAHRLELGVILDVVYNHFGPDGNYLSRFAPRYVSERRTDWGEAINFDGDDAAPVREFFLTNARYWVEEFHFDGLRLDATQQIFDERPSNIMTEICEAVHDAAGERCAFVVGENEPQDVKLLTSKKDGGYSIDGLWNDDFHHSAQVAATGRGEAYYSGYRGNAQELLSAAKYGFLYQGEWYRWQNNGRGTLALEIPPERFIIFTQNHDQVANTVAGRRMHEETSPGRYRALTALMLCLPQTPMLFMGQEFAASSPFLYFADHTSELSKLVKKGREDFLGQFPSIKTPDGTSRIDDPMDPRTFIRSKLDWSERRTHVAAVALHRDLIRLRRDDPALCGPRPRAVDGAVINDRAFVLRYFGGEHGDRLLVVNMGDRLHADPFAEPLIALPREQRWETVFSTEDTKYGGWGTPAIQTKDDGWWLPAECTALLKPTDDATPSR